MIDRTLDARALPFAADSIDLIICSHVLEHIPEDVQVASEFARVLSPRGAALVQVPVNPTLSETFEDPAIVTPAEREQAYGRADHVRIYAPDVLERLRAGGLNVRRVQYAEQVDPELRSRYLRSERGNAPGGDIFTALRPHERSSTTRDDRRSTARGWLTAQTRTRGRRVAFRACRACPSMRW